MATIATILFALAAQATPVVAAAIDIPEPNPSRMSNSEIRDHNAKLPKDHRYYISCVKAVDTGSLVARRPVCRTNQTWAAIDAAGRERARDLGDEAVARSASSTSN